MDIGTLKPCPFCGEDAAKLLDQFDFVNGAKKTFTVKCANCGSSTKECGTNFEALDCWNRRDGE